MTGVRPLRDCLLGRLDYACGHLLHITYIMQGTSGAGIQLAPPLFRAAGLSDWRFFWSLPTPSKRYSGTALITAKHVAPRKVGSRRLQGAGC